MPKVFANSRSIVHAGDGSSHTAAPPDVCKTPSPAGPTPVPYVNVARSRDLAEGTKQVKIEGKSVAHASANLRVSAGDEAGTAGGGLISSKTKGKLTWASSSPTVKFEGKGVVRFGDATQHNGNTFNTAFTTMGGTSIAYADDFETPCPICGYGPDEHRIHEHSSSAELCQRIIDELDAIYRSLERRTGSQYGKAFRRPYMIGVMICGVCEKAFAARSGADKGSYFGDAVNAAGCTRVQGAPTSADLATVNGCADPKVTPSAALDDAWRNAAKKVDSEKKYPDYVNAPGHCAAQKLMAVSAHVPHTMTERFYMPPWAKNPKPMTISYLRTDLSARDLARFVSEPLDSPFRKSVLANRQVTRADLDFAHGDTVGSCRTCQDLIFLTNCPTRTCGG